MAKYQNLPPSPGPPKIEFLVIFKGVLQFLGGPFVFISFLCCCLFFLGFIYFVCGFACFGIWPYYFLGAALSFLIHYFCFWAVLSFLGHTRR